MSKKRGGIIYLFARKNYNMKVKVSGKDFSEWSSLYMVQGLAAHEGPIWCLAWSPSGMYLASAGQDAVVNVWKVVRVEA
jgi:WD40 repeat protein